MPAIEGFVPHNVIRCFRAYLDFCYIARMSVFTRSALDRLDEALGRFQLYRTVFQELGVRDPTPSGFSLPRQHAMAHYRQHIENFGAPNGLCSSITESKHIVAVKRPWRRSSRYNPIKQIMLVNQRMEKLTTARVRFISQGMLKFPTWQPRLVWAVPSDDDEDQSGAAHEDAIHNEVFLAQTHGESGTMQVPSTLLTPSRIAPNYPRSLHGLGQRVGHPNLPDLVQKYLLQRAHPDANPNAEQSLPAPNHINPPLAEYLKVFHSARAIFCAPSNPSTSTGMHHETIRATPSWNRGQIPGPRHDCVFVSNGESSESNMSGLLIARVFCFFSFVTNGELHQCALIHWFSIFGDQPDPDNGMWVVTPDYFGSAPSMSVIHIDSIFRAAHLLPIFDARPLPRALNYTSTLDSFKGFYVNNYIDYHTYETVM